MYDKEVLEVKKKVDKMLAHKTPQYKQGYNEAIDDAIELVKVMITELDVKGCTKYGNKNAEQQNKSYDTLMKYEIAESIDDLLCRLEVLKD